MNDKTKNDIDYVSIKELVDRYRELQENGELKRYNEAETKTKFIEPLFEALGWNIRGIRKSNDKVTLEEKISKDRVDYGFWLNDTPKFYLEAKSLRENDILFGKGYDKQAINYSWLKSCSWAVLTNFRTLAVYNADKPEGDWFFTIHAEDFLDKDREKLEILSKESFEQNKIDEKALEWGKKLIKKPVDKQLLEDMIHFREVLSKDILRNNQNLNLSQDDIDETVQRILDRLIFIRNAEDRGLEPNELQSNFRQWSVQEKGKLISKIREIYARYKEVYDSGLFGEEDQSPHLSDTVNVSNEALREVIQGLYSPHDSYSYDFSVIVSDTLGSIYEQYLGNILKTTPKRAKLSESKTHRKEQGIYYTPSYIVDYIVKNTVGEFIKTHTPDEIRKVRILDPSCGSGSFLIRAYKELENYWKQNSDFAQLTLDSEEFYSKKVEILKNNIFGVDLDPKAVEIAQLNLLLQISEKKQRLPLLQTNIKVGNSLIDDPSVSDKAFKWEEEFPEIMKTGGFDIIIGNPPYGKGIEGELKFLNLKGINDTYTAFMVKAKHLLKKKGILGFIVPVSWQTGERYIAFRKEILSELSPIKVVNLPFDTFEDAYVDTCIAIFTKDHTEKFYGYSYPKKMNVNRLLDVDSRFSIIMTNEIFEDKSLKIVLNDIAKDILRRLDNKEFVDLGSISKSTIGILASKYTITNDKLEGFLPFFNGNVYRYKLTQSVIKYVDMSKHRNDSLYYYQNKRILVRRIISRKDRIMATIVDENFVNKKDLYSFKVTNNEFLPEYVLGLINSKLLSYIYVQTSTISTKDDFRQTTLAELRRLPIRKVDEEEQKQVSNLVIKMIDLNKKLLDFKDKNSDKRIELEKRILETDKEIDDLVYRIYGITEEEKKLIEETLSQ